MERFVFRPWGMAGGRPGEKARVVVNLGRPDERELGKIDIFHPKVGDIVTIMTPGGGGYGDPLERPAAVVLEDVLDGYISEAAAREDYGVVIAGGVVDEAATLGLRERMARQRGPLKPFEFGPERDAWEAVFDDDTMTRLNALLMRLGTHMRTERRREIYETVVPDLPKVGVRPLHDIMGDTGAARERLAAEIARLEAEVPAG
jgi:N-methylhydantoinase B